MLHDAEFWVAVAFVIFVGAVIYFGAHKLLLAGLDERATRIRGQLDEARRLREEAQTALAEAKRRLRDAQREAEEMVKAAKEEAGLLRFQAETNLDQALKRREAQAVERIAQAEAAALKDVRDQAVDLAIAATARVLGTRLDGAAGTALIDDAIRDLPKRLQ